MKKPASFPSLDGASVYISGGSSGIGATMVRRFADQGAKVAFCGLHPERGQKVEADLAGAKHRPTFFAVDIRDVDALQASMRDAAVKNGAISVLINNAADDTRHTLDALTPAYWDDRVALNLKHYAFAAQEAARQMRSVGGGSIINLSSISWKLGIGDYVAYATCKAATHGLTRVLARELGKDMIRVNTLTPGWVMTERQIELWLDAEGEKAMDEGQCMKVRLQSEDIAAMALFLAAEDSRYATSQDFTIDAGWS